MTELIADVAQRDYGLQGVFRQPKSRSQLHVLLVAKSRQVPWVRHKGANHSLDPRFQMDMGAKDSA